MHASIELAPGAEENGLAVMLADLVRQNLESKPHKVGDFVALAGAVSIVADDADVALTLRFDRGQLRIHDGIVGIPDLTIRGPSDTILALSNMPSFEWGPSPIREWIGKLGLPIPNPGDKEAAKLVRSVVDAVKSGAFHIYGAAFHLPLLVRLSRVMSVNG
jgi:hypothetical protein